MSQFKVGDRVVGKNTKKAATIIKVNLEYDGINQYSIRYDDNKYDHSDPYDCNHAGDSSLILEAVYNSPLYKALL